MFKKFAAATLLISCAALAHAGVVTTGDISWLSTTPATTATPVLSSPDIALSPGATAYGTVAYGGPHTIPHLNDGTYGNSNSWLGLTAQNVQDPTLTNTIGQGFAGIDLPGSFLWQLSGFEFGRDATGVYGDRVAGTYTIQYTIVPNPTAATLDSAYTTLGTISISGAAGDALRQVYSIPTPVFATGFRIVVPDTFTTNGGGAQAIDEIEIQGVPEPSTFVLCGIGLVGLVCVACRRRALAARVSKTSAALVLLLVLSMSGLAHATVITTGDIALVSTGPTASNVPASPIDIALSSNGATAYASSLIGNGAFAPTHTIANLNNGTYGNSSSWIGGDSQNVQDPSQTTTLGQGFAGIDLPGTFQWSLTSFAFGRDNTGGLSDRANGTYYVQYTTVVNPNASTGDNLYTTLGSIVITGNDALRHLYSIPVPVLATGLRIIVPLTANSDFFGAQAIDEIEIIGVPEPSTFMLCGLGLVGLVIARLRRKASK